MPRSLFFASLLLALAANAFPASPAIGFEENKGQYPNDILYASRVGVALSSESLVLTKTGVSMRFLGASSAAPPRPGDTIPGQVDLIGPGAQRTIGIRQYASVRRTAIYPGIDASFVATDGGPNGSTVTCGFVVHPGAKPGDIRIQVAGATSVQVERDTTGGHLLIDGAPLFERPRVTQGALLTAGRYVLSGDTVTIAVDSYDATQDFSIVMLGTRSASIDRYWPYMIASPSGGYYELGTVPQMLASASRVPPFANDVAVVHRAASGEPQHLTFLTGTGTQELLGAAVRKPSPGRPDEIVSFTGFTTAPDLPLTANAPGKGYAHIFVAAVDGMQGTLLYSTYLANTGDIGGWNVRFDAAGALYVTGPLFVGQTAYATKIDLPSGAILSQTQLPGSVNAADVDASGRVYFTGYAGADFPVTSGAYRTTPPTVTTGFAARLKADGSGLDYATWLGKENWQGFQIVVDSHGRAWITLMDRNIATTSLVQLDASGGGASLTEGPRPGDYLFVDAADNLVSIAATNQGLLAGKYDATGHLVLQRLIESAYAVLGLDAGNRLLITGADGAVTEIELPVSTSGWASASVNAASWDRANVVAPGEIITLVGSGMGPAQGLVFQPDAQNRVPMLTGGTRVLFNGVPGPVLYSQANQVNAIVPFSVRPGMELTIQVEYLGQPLAPLPITVAPAQPGIFTQDGKLALAFNEDGTLNSDRNPARPGTIVTFFATGLGATAPTSIEGSIANSTAPKPQAPYNLYFFGPAEILYAGPSPGSLSSITQFNVRVPSSLASVPGDVIHPALSLTQTSEGYVPQTTWIAVR